ncbi:hypothetical protein Bca101_026547 [Brassica carinata]
MIESLERGSRRPGTGCKGSKFANGRLMNPEYSLFSAAPMGGHVKPRLFSDDPFSSLVSSWERASGTDDEAAPKVPLKQGRSYLLDDGPRSRVRGEDLAEIRRRYAIPSTVGIRNPSEFERAPDGGVNELAIYEAYLEAGIRNGVPSLVAEVSSNFGFCPSQLTPLSWRTLMAIQVLGELRGFYIGVREVQEPIRYPMFWHTVDVSRPVSFVGEAVAKLVMNIPLQFRWVSFLVSKEALCHSRLWGATKGRCRGRGYRSFPGDAQMKLFAEMLSFRSQVQDMMVQRDRLVQQVRVEARWELMKEWLEERTGCWNPGEEYRRYLSLFGRPSVESGHPTTPMSTGLRVSAGLPF